MSNRFPSGEIPRGALRFNTDSNRLELWDGYCWAEIELVTPDMGVSTSDAQPGPRGVMAAGYQAPTNREAVNYINISSTGDALDFGDLAARLRYQAGCSSRTRGLTLGGYAVPGNNYPSTIYKTTIASTGSHLTFGNIKVGGSNSGLFGHACFSNQTRALSCSGNDGAGGQYDEIKYLTIASDGDTVDFGEMTYNFRYGLCTGSKIRAMPMGGYSTTAENVINMVTISTLGDAQDFGDLSSYVSDSMGSTTNGIRSIVHIRHSGWSDVTLESYDPTSGGTTTPWGDLTSQRQFSPMNSCLSSPTRGVFPGGTPSPGSSGADGTIDYVEFSTQGNAVDFGDMETAMSSGSYFSNAHGGL